MKKIFILILALTSLSAMGMDCKIMDEEGNTGVFTSSESWDGPISGPIETVISSEGPTDLSGTLMDKFSSYSISLQGWSQDDLFSLDENKLLKIVLLRDETEVASKILSMDEEGALLHLPEFELTLECKKTQAEILGSMCE